MIRLCNVSKIYDRNARQTEALKNISLTIEKGEMVAVMGTSGSGKSTLLNIMGGLDTPTSGEYFFDEAPVRYNKRKELHSFRKQHISFVFQNFELMNRYTVYENVDMPLIARNIKKRKKLVMDVLTKVGISEIYNKKVSKLSGGQQQRCAIARALIADTDVILADEPTGSLDSKTSAEIMELLVSINKAGKTVIIVTHDAKVAAQCGRTIEIEDGEIL